MKTWAGTYLDSLLQLFFPHNCLSCYSDALYKDQLLCANCLQQLPYTNFFSQPENPVAKSFYGRVHVKNAAAAFYFTKHSIIQQLMIALKYRGEKDAGKFLGNQIGWQIKQSGNYNDIDVLIPMPLNEKKLKKRGYNQAEVIANGIAEIIKKPVITDAVIRSVFTETQTKKDRISRWQSMEGVFVVADKKLIENKHVLLIDDVITTGATLESCIAAIKNTAHVEVSIACAAYTI